MPELSPHVINYLPWLAGSVVLLTMLVLLLNRSKRLQRQLQDEQHAHELSRAQIVSVGEKLSASLAESTRLRDESKVREVELKKALELQHQAHLELGKFNTALEADKAALSAELKRLPELSAELDNARRRADELAQQYARLETDHVGVKTRAHEQLQAASEKIALLEQAELRLSKEFENLANRIFEDKQKKFNETSKSGVEALLNPVRQQLSDFRKKVEDIYDTENRDRASLRAEITQLKTLNERISGDALNLTKALTGDSKVRGNWGEIQLERLLEQSGLVKGREYEVQGSFKSVDGQRFQPDVVVHLPERKDVIIDSKVSLVAYEQYHAHVEDEQRKQHSRAHIASLRAHINGLSAKNYDELIGVNSLDLVIMFVPIEPALLLALEHEPALYEEAFKKRILMVSPSTLMGTLQIIHNIWRYEQQNRNTLEIAAQAGNLYDAFVNFAESLDKIGVALDKAQAEYQTAHKRLISGRGNLVTRTEKLRILGIKTKKAMAEKLLEAAEQDDEEDPDEPAGYLRAAPDPD